MNDKRRLLDLATGEITTVELTDQEQAIKNQADIDDKTAKDAAKLARKNRKKGALDALEVIGLTRQQSAAFAEFVQDGHED